MYYSDKRVLTRDEFIRKLNENDPLFYYELKRRNYKFWANTTYNLADGLAQKCVRNDNGDILFYIDCYIYIYDKERFHLYPDNQERVMPMIESHFYLDNNEDRYCTVQLHIKDLDYAEKFFLEFFVKYNCVFYEKAN